MRVENGPITRFDQFDLDDLASSEALMRSWESPRELDNEAVRALRRGCHAISIRDFDDLAASATDDVLYDDRRTGLANSVTGDLCIAMARATEGELTMTPVAIRGEHLALGRVTFLDHVSGFTDEPLVITEPDELGRTAANIVFDGGDILGAIAELDRRNRLTMSPAVAATIAMLNRLSWALNTGDAAGFEALIAPDFRIIDRQILGYGSLDRAGTLASVDAMGDPDHVLFVRSRTATTSSRWPCAALVRIFYVGEQTGHSAVTLVITEVDAAGQGVASITFDDDDLDAAMRALDRRHAAIGS